MATPTIKPTKEELELIQIKRDRDALALKEALIKQKGEREKSIEKEKTRGNQIIEIAKRKNKAIETLMFDLIEYAGRGVYEVVSKDRSVDLKCYDYALKQDIEGKVYSDYKSEEQVYFKDQLDYQDHHIKHILSGKSIYPHLEKGTVVFRFDEYSGYGRCYTRAKKMDQIISEAYNGKIAKENKVVNEAQEQELLYNMCQRAYPQAEEIKKVKDPQYNYTGNRGRDKQWSYDKLLVQVTFKSGFIITCCYNKPIKEGDKPTIGIWSKNISKLSNEDLLKHFGK